MKRRPLSNEHNTDLPSERERVLQCGARICRLCISGQPSGPERIWLQTRCVFMYSRE
jgi:hypothetical protein